MSLYLITRGNITIVNLTIVYITIVDKTIVDKTIVDKNIVDKTIVDKTIVDKTIVNITNVKITIVNITIVIALEKQPQKQHTSLGMICSELENRKEFLRLASFLLQFNRKFPNDFFTSS